MLHGLAISTASARNRGVINSIEVPRGTVAAKLGGFGVFLITEHAVVEHDNCHLDADPHGSFELRPGVREAAVANHDDNLSVGARQLSAERER